MAPHICDLNILLS